MNKTKGFTLIELMIAALIGLFLITGLFNLFITTNRSVSMSDGLSKNQETGRFALDYLTTFIHQAGYGETFTVVNPPLYFGAFCDIGIGQDACAANDVDQGGDRLSIGLVTSPNNEMKSCSGQNIGGANGEQQIVNVFWVDNAQQELICRTYDRQAADWLNGEAPVSILSNVEQFHFQVGLAADINSKSAARYVSIDQLNDVKLLRSVRIAILTTGDDDATDAPLQTNITERNYTLLDGPQTSFNDGVFRQIFSNTVELPNSIESAQFN